MPSSYPKCQFYGCGKPATVRLHFQNDSLPGDYCTHDADVVRVRVSRPNSRTGRVVRKEALTRV